MMAAAPISVLVNNYWKPALAQIGIKNPTVFTYFQCHSVSDCATTTSDFSSAVLKFRQAGVDHVLFTPDGGDAVFFFFQVAHSQKYYPRDGMTTASGPSLFNTEPKDEQGNAVAVSWSSADVYPNLPAIAHGRPGQHHQGPVRGHAQAVLPGLLPAVLRPV